MVSRWRVWGVGCRYSVGAGGGWRVSGVVVRVGAGVDGRVAQRAVVFPKSVVVGGRLWRRVLQGGAAQRGFESGMVQESGCGGRVLCFWRRCGLGLGLWAGGRTDRAGQGLRAGQDRTGRTGRRGWGVLRVQ